MDYKIESDKGIIVVNKNVIAEIAAIKANECDGVAGMCAKGIKSGIVGLLKPESATKGIDVKIEGKNTIEIFMHIIVEYGFNINDVSNSIINAVKNQLVSALGIDNAVVGVKVEGIVKTGIKKKNDSLFNVENCEDIGAVLGIKSGLIGYVKENEGKFNALIDDKTLLSSEDINTSAKALAEHMLEKIENPGIIAIHYIEGLDDSAYELSDCLSEKYEGIDVEVHCVEGSDYDYIIGVE